MYRCHGGLNLGSRRHGKTSLLLLRGCGAKASGAESYEIQEEISVSQTTDGNLQPKMMSFKNSAYITPTFIIVDNWCVPEHCKTHEHLKHLPYTSANNGCYNYWIEIDLHSPYSSNTKKTEGPLMRTPGILYLSKIFLPMQYSCYQSSVAIGFLVFLVWHSNCGSKLSGVALLLGVVDAPEQAWPHRPVFLILYSRLLIYHPFWFPTPQSQTSSLSHSYREPNFSSCMGGAGLSARSKHVRFRPRRRAGPRRENGYGHSLPPTKKKHTHCKWYNSDTMQMYHQITQFSAILRRTNRNYICISMYSIR